MTSIPRALVPSLVTARRHGLTVPNIRGILAGAGLVVTTGAIQHAVRGVLPPKRRHRLAAQQLVLAGHTYREVAERFGISKSCVQKWSRGLGVARGGLRLRQVQERAGL